MSIGTRSLLFGAHQFIIHPIAIAIAWWKLYGIPLHPALWLAFVVHDWGYWGKTDMDGESGASHPELGASIVGFFFGQAWRDFTIAHSRRYAKMKNHEVSQLCVADKLATVIMPPWLYVILTRATGEIEEYKKLDAALESQEFEDLAKHAKTDLEWFDAVRTYMKRVTYRMKDTALDISAFRTTPPS